MVFKDRGKEGSTAAASSKAIVHLKWQSLLPKAAAAATAYVLCMSVEIDIHRQADTQTDGRTKTEAETDRQRIDLMKSNDNGRHMRSYTTTQDKAGQDRARRGKQFGKTRQV